MREKYIWNPATYSCKNDKYLASITDNPVITCDEIIEETKTVPTNFNEKMQPVKQKIYIFSTNFNEKMQPVKQKISIFYLPFY